jgi:hypothetical protein
MHILVFPFKHGGKRPRIALNIERTEAVFAVNRFPPLRRDPVTPLPDATGAVSPADRVKSPGIPLPENYIHRMDGCNVSIIVMVTVDHDTYPEPAGGYVVM